MSTGVVVVTTLKNFETAVSANSIYVNYINYYMSYFAYACKMRCPLNLVLENSEYLWFYSTFCIVILDYCLKLHKLSNHTLVILQK